MGTTPQSQMALAHDPAFLDRLQYLVCQVAIDVKNEGSGVAGHAARAAYAGQVLANPAEVVAQIAVTIVGSTNLLAANTGYDFVAGGPFTDATDIAIRGQIATLWNAFAGVL